jgi:hypothetical protein
MPTYPPARLPACVEKKEVSCTYTGIKSGGGAPPITMHKQQRAVIVVVGGTTGGEEESMLPPAAVRRIFDLGLLSDFP